MKGTGHVEESDSVERSGVPEHRRRGCENEDQGAEFAKMLDDSGNVIVLGNVVFLRPEQVQFKKENIYIYIYIYFQH